MATQTNRRLDGIIHPRDTSTWTESTSGTHDREEGLISSSATESIEISPRHKTRPLEFLTGMLIWFLDTAIFIIQDKVIPLVSRILTFPFKFLRSWLFESILFMFFSPFAIGKRLALSLGLVRWILEALQMEKVQTRNVEHLQELNSMRMAVNEMSTNLEKASAERDSLLRDRTQKNQLEKEKDLMQKKLKDLEMGWKMASSDLAEAKEELKNHVAVLKENDVLHKKLKDMEDGWRLATADLLAAKEKLQIQDALLTEHQQLQSCHAAELGQMESRMREENERNKAAAFDQHQFELENTAVAIREQLAHQFEQQKNDLRDLVDRTGEEKLRLEEELDALRSSIAEDQSTSKARQIRELKAQLRNLQNQLQLKDGPNEVQMIQ